MAAFAVDASAASRQFYGLETAVTLRSLDLAGLGSAPAGRVAAPGSGVFQPAAGRHRRDGRGLAREDRLQTRRHGGARRRVCFAASPADGTRAVLWSCCLDPGAKPGTAALDVPDGVEELALATGCGGGCPTFWTTSPAKEARP